MNTYNIIVLISALVILGLSIWAFMTRCNTDKFGDDIPDCPNINSNGNCLAECNKKCEDYKKNLTRQKDGPKDCQPLGTPRDICEGPIPPPDCNKNIIKINKVSDLIINFDIEHTFNCLPPAKYGLPIGKCATDLYKKIVNTAFGVRACPIIRINHKNFSQPQSIVNPDEYKGYLTLKIPLGDEGKSFDSYLFAVSIDTIYAKIDSYKWISRKYDENYTDWWIQYIGD